jgi:hypothetical protein
MAPGDVPLPRFNEEEGETALLDCLSLLVEALDILLSIDIPDLR